MVKRRKNRRPFIRFFDRYPEKLQEASKLLNAGMSVAAISRKYGVDHTSIIHRMKLGHIKRDGISYRITPPPPSNIVPINLGRPEDGTEIINLGHDYKWYLESEKRRKEKSWQELISRGKKISTVTA